MDDRRKQANPAILEAINTSIASAINIHVNGKIDKMSHKFDDYVEGDLRWKNNVDIKLKELEPVSVGLKTISGVRRIVIYLGGFGVSGGAIYYFIKEIFK